jgi:hypothetical protein
MVALMVLLRDYFILAYRRYGGWVSFLSKVEGMAFCGGVL